MSRPRPIRSSRRRLAAQPREHARERAADLLGDVAVDLLAVEAADVVGLEDLLGTVVGMAVEAARRLDAAPLRLLRLEPRRAPRLRAGGARSWAGALAERGIGLVYGGASVGLMGGWPTRRSTRAARSIGVIPQALVDREIATRALDDLRVVGSMHERKALMAELADGFIALPGGIGTLEELFEVYTWTQLGLHSKPLGLLDVRGYYAQLVAFLDHAVAERFVTVEHREMLVVEPRAEALLEAFRRWRAPVRSKWIDRSRT